MKTLGMIGGVGPESTIDYYSSIIATYRRLKPDGSYPQFFINSIDLDKGRSLISSGNLPGIAQYLVQEIHNLARAGAEVGLIAANTPHLVFDEVQRQSPIPLISIVEATAAVAKRMNLKRAGLFATTFTIKAGFYPKIFAKYGIDVVSPAASDQDFIHDKYMNELVEGVFRDETRNGLLAIVDKMAAEHGIDAVILGGTEIPLILRDEAHNGIPLLNTTKIHVAAAVAEMLS
ncbi:MAG: aspartate/glutamate racemase family protein [Chthoniobacterales bacterium]